jgi:hypothetical protein
MREVQAMHAGCVDVQRGEDGLIERHRISAPSTARDVRGQAERWIIIASVAKAVSCGASVIEGAADTAQAFRLTYQLRTNGLSAPWKVS